ncbi:23S rRNA (uracil(1939)-C(5))-methyltransferase RlmD [Halopseudomonas yangmingensis]|uniref:23S rRNA (uracil(1939)-C(5))-methyltransferase RlmD n=1 Tax=Halopseudomonas yangmingensis TaxID=1720063 RepID=A0A1I4N6H9_9GAMM|nr:23S rRNA (uracil(1939)-C(5))-methyltransferase RlmD [Halopseudomonas yangmingensis]SFM10937.1 23S rRNA (uracil1939-C5)-methyltransferase [Halopseudomonas yangmingensis]
MSRQRGRPRQPSAGPAAVGQRIELVIERLSHDGRGIGRWRGVTTFVEGALPGEQVQARVQRARSKLVEARLETLLQAIPERLTPRCAHFALCGGCSLQHMPAGQQLALRREALQQQLQHFAGVQPEQWAEPLRGPEYGYRQRCRVALLPEAGRVQVGFRQRSSNALVEVGQCPVLEPRLEALLPRLAPLFNSLDSRARLGHAELLGGAAQALLVRHIGQPPAADRQRLIEFAASEAIDCWLLAGDQPAECLNNPAARLAYALPGQGLQLGFAPGDFIQVNPQVNQQMVAQALEWLAPQAGEAILDLFCGVGNFALALARRGARVTGIEGSAAMVEQAQHNARDNGLEGLHFFAADLSKPLQPALLPGEYAAALLDPPRDGAEALVQQLAQAQVQRILYVSCNPATLARDAGLLVAEGYRLQRIGLLDMFPQTAHVEAMALFCRAGIKQRGSN